MKKNYAVVNRYFKNLGITDESFEFFETEAEAREKAELDKSINEKEHLKCEVSIYKLDENAFDEDGELTVDCYEHMIEI